MFDITARPLKDQLFDPVCSFVPARVTPFHVTLVAFLLGALSCILTATNNVKLALVCWLLNRAFDCLDGALARHRRQATDAGGFLDLLSDFIIYSTIPIVCGVSQPREDDYGPWMAISVLEATFHINNFILFYIGAILEKQKAASKGNETSKVKELTSVAMRPALIEGLESGVIFTIMLAAPTWTREISWSMAALVCVGIVQRLAWLLPVL